MDQIKRVILASSIPLVLASTPAARWGHQALFVPSEQAMYVIGGEVVQSGSKVTNDVLVLPLNSTGPSFTSGPNDALPPHAFAAATLSEDGSSIVVLGGMTSSCGSDAVAHTLDLGTSTWTHGNPTKFVRRRGAAATWVDNGSTDGAMMVVGGVADQYSCSSSTYTYPASDVLSFPLRTSSLISTRNLPDSLTGSSLAVSDFAFTRTSNGSLYLVGGQSASGTLVPLGTIGKWTESDGWVSQATTGDVPVGRVGASLVAHPTLDLLVLHGGSVGNTSTSTLAFLNTTSWQWTLPSNLQPPASSAASYHSSVMTPSGVMITAFGLGATGSPSSNVFYLDMRDPTQNAWTWKSAWKNDMLSAYVDTSSTTTTGSTGNTNASTNGTSGVVGGEAVKDSSAPSKKTVTTIVVPVIIGCLILIPLLVLFIRRRIRIAKKRRMARHFSFSSQEDSGEFTGSLDHYHSPLRRTRVEYPFGRDANEKEGNMFSDVVSAVKRLSTRRRRSIDSDTTDGEDNQREMSERGSPVRVQRLSEKAMKWEEIDFGLGKLDERQRSSFNGQLPGVAAGVASTTVVDPFADQPPLLVDIVQNNSPRFGTPLHDGQAPLVPELHVMPPSEPPTPAPPRGLAPAFNPSQEDGLDWSLLAQEMTAKPAFRSISPTSPLRSHAHPSAVNSGNNGPAPVRTPSPVPRTASPVTPRSSGPPRLPSLEFQRPASVAGSSPTVSLVNPRTGRRISEQNLPFAFNQAGSPRAVSQPMNPNAMGARQLAGNMARRGSAPYSASSSGSTTPTGRGSFDGSVASSANNAMMQVATPGRRASASHLPFTPGTFGEPGSPSAPSARRESAMSRLRVVNLTDEDEEVKTEESGVAL